MALDKIHEYPITATAFTDDAFLDMDDKIDGVYESQKIPIQLMYEKFRINLGNTDLTINDSIRTLVLSGLTTSEKFSIKNSGGTTIAEFTGDKNTILYGKIGINGAIPSGFYGLNMLGDFNTNGNIQVGSQIKMQQSGFSLIQSIGNKYMNKFSGGQEWGTNSTVYMKLGTTGILNLTNLPNSSTGLVTGDLWNNSGVINII